MPLPCHPDSLPLSDLRWREILPLVGRANASLARYDGMLQTLPNSAILLSPITANEAVLSSKIEGTQATLDEVLEAEAGLIISETRRGDIEEIGNYRAAVSIAEAALLHRPITLSLIREVHQRLLKGVRGRDKMPGKFRDDQNWIGRRGDPIEKRASCLRPLWCSTLHLRNGRPTSVSRQRTLFCKQPLHTPSLRFSTPSRMATDE
ncbi:hypothetical protein E6W36_03690 [Hankyongella ginsenosidimutans]|uniref:Fic/DOC N-terminal domain-containing protein n=1 Tax=Hankyongella ginsenosidimutans TaxID=1763828 RepID=A0A4D7C5P8_9SPHN|nr:hypothetical protein E6W36_03690 [Hankyongella ginsenosidimutans]